MIGTVGQGGVSGSASVAGVDPSGFEVGASVKVRSREDSASSTDPQFGEVWKKIQAQYGGKAEKPREIKKSLGKDDFLKLMIMQMKYQDPSKPFEMEKMGAEMAQLSSMEQLQNLNQTMKQLATRDQPVERMAMTGMIGKTVTVDRARFPHVEGESDALKFNLPVDASNLSVTILDETGAPIIERELGPHAKGDGVFSWDGIKANTIPAKSGNYSYQVTAVDAMGREMKISSTASSRVVGVSFEGQKPVLLVGDSSAPEKVFMENVSRVIDDGGKPSEQVSIPGAKPLASAVSSGDGAFFTFKKGEGSKPVEDSPAIEAYKAQLSGFEGKGFPSGLSSQE